MPIQYRKLRACLRWPSRNYLIGALPARLAALLLVHGLFLAGCRPNGRPAVIEGASMAPHLFGIHNLLTCRDCQFNSVLRADQPIKNPICSNCGAANSAERLQRQAAPEVRLSSFFTPPQRWKVYAFKAPQRDASQEKITVKRVVGLPSETIHLTEGDLWINGQREVKSWADQLELVILLRDFRCLPRDDAGKPRSPWASSDHTSDWSVDTKRISFSSKNPSQAARRIDYCHWAGYHTGQDRFAATPILDAQPFDPLEARTLQSVSDLLVTARLETPTDNFRLGLQVYEEPLACEWRGTESKIEIRSGERLLHTIKWTPQAGETTIGFSTFDRTATVMVNGQQLAQIPLPLTPSTARNRLSRPLFIEALADSLVLRDFKLYRDVYYSDRGSEPSGHEPPRAFPLDSGEYFLLGDNPVDSIDSRDWPAHGLKRAKFLGEVNWKGQRNK